MDVDKRLEVAVRQFLKEHRYKAIKIMLHKDTSHWNSMKMAVKATHLTPSEITYNALSIYFNIIGV